MSSPLTRTTDGGPYLWEQPAWPDGLFWAPAPVAAALAAAHHAHGQLLAKASLIGFAERARLEAVAYEEEAVFTSQLEGERLDRDSVRSSVAWQLGLSHAGLPPRARDTDGVVAVLLDATRDAQAPVTLERLYGWHAALFPTGFSGPHRITVGSFRSGSAPMQVVSGVWGHPIVHFEAPPSSEVLAQARAFLAWIEAPPVEGDGFLRAGIAHLRFVTLHPFDDGNGRITRALTDLLLTRAAPSTRLWSLSAQIQSEEERARYYEALQSAQRGTGDITAWLVWFVGCIARALARAEAAVDLVLYKARFWAQHPHHACNPRQLKVMDRLLQAGPGGFEGGMTTRKAAALTRASRATAQRDLSELVERGLLRPLPGQGRSAAYEVAWP